MLFAICYLLINTAFAEAEIALFSTSKIEFYKQWKTKQEALEIAHILEKIDLKDLKGVIVCSGPGRFTSLRVGVSIAQALKFSLGLQLYVFSATEYLAFQMPKNYVTLQQVAMGEVFVNGERQKFEELDDVSKNWVGDVRTPHLLPESWSQQECAVWGVSDFNDFVSSLSSVERVEIVYGKEPSIG